MTRTIDALLDAGTAHQARGDLTAAAQQYRKALEQDPTHADALQLLGGLMLFQNQLEEAGALLRRALARAPRSAMIRTNLAAVYLKTGQPKRALTECRKANQAEPDNVPVLRQLALAAEQAGQPADAAAALDRLAALGVGTVDDALKSAALHLTVGDGTRAETAALRAAAFRAKPDQTHTILAAVALRKRDWRSLIGIATAWTQASPNNPAAHEMLARAHLEAGDIHTAQKSFAQVFALTPSLDPTHALTYGRICLITQDFAAAEAALSRAAAALPDSSDAAFSLARLYTFQGELEQARVACDAALSRDPSSIRAYVQWTALMRGEVTTERRRAMERLWKRADAPAELLSSLGFALGDIAHRAARHDRAFDYYSQANRLTAQTYAKDGAVYDRNGAEERMARIMALQDVLDAEEFTPAPSPVRPIFIVGMPRSGTTLTESILAAHPSVFGAGEVLTGAKILEDALARVKPSDNGSPSQLLAQNAETWRGAYLSSLPDMGGAPLVTDKLPINFLGIGLLARLFPEAHFIHIRRDPLDTSLSIFRHAFPRAYDWSHDLGAIGHFYGLYRRITAFFEERLGARITRVQYEDIPEDPEGQIRTLVAAAGLDWDPRCLDFHQDKRAIATFSSVQVRSPISKTSIGVAERYRPFLLPLINALDS